jgi:hypothetical protein
MLFRARSREMTPVTKMRHDATLALVGWYLSSAFAPNPSCWQGLVRVESLGGKNDSIAFGSKFMKILNPLTRLVGLPVSDVHECPHCASQKIRLSRKPQPRLYKLLGFARYRCNDCDASYVRWQRRSLAVKNLNQQKRIRSD